MTTTTTDDLDARRSNLTAHVEALTQARDDARAALTQIEDEHRDAATAGDPTRAAQAVSDRRALRDTLSDAETDLTAAQGWLSDTLAAIRERDAVAAAARARVEADEAYAEFRDVLASVTKALDERIAAVMEAVGVQRDDFTRLRVAMESAQAREGVARQLAGQPPSEAVDREFNIALRGSEALTRGWHAARSPHPGPMLVAITESVRSTDVEFRR